MKTYTVSLFLILMTLSAVPVNGQLLKKLKQAAEDGVKEAVERRVEHEVEKAVQKQTDRYMEQIFGPPTQYEGRGYDYGKMMESINMNVETEDSYSFTGYTDMEISGTNEKGKPIDPTMFRTFIDPEGQSWGIELESDDKDLKRTVMIFDNHHQATIMLMESNEGEKSRLAYGMDWSKMMEAGTDETAETMDETFNFEKTGNTKTILGYTCDEYVTDTETYNATYWVSREPVTGYTSYWSRNNFLFNQQMKKKYSDYLDKLPEGDMMEMTYTSKEDDNVTIMKIIDINTSTQNEFVMADYKNAMEQNTEGND